MPSYRQKVFRGLAWRSSVDLSQQLLQIIFTAILARLLTKADFGLVAMAMLFTRFIRTMTSVGFGTAIIQSPDITQAQISALFLIQVIIAALISLVCFFAAPLAAAFFNTPNLIPVIQALTWAMLINGFAFPRTLLRKNLQFGGLSLLELISMVVGNIIGVIMAFKGFGVWALVFRLLSQRILFSAAIWPVAGWTPVRPSFAGTSKFAHFGLNMLGSKIFKYFSQNMAAIITGRFIGVETLGSFNIAYNQAIVPAQKVQSVLTSILYPAFASIHTDLAEFRHKFYLSVFSLGVVFIPLMLGLSAVAQKLVLVVYGAKWQEAGVFLTFLAVVGMLKGMEHLFLSVIIVRGWASFVFWIAAAETALSLPLLFLSSYFFGVMGLIIAYLVASFFAFVLTVTAAQRAVEDNTLILRATHRSFIMAGIMFCVVFGYSFVAPPSALATLCLQVTIGLVIYTLFRIKLLTTDERAIIRSWPRGDRIASLR